MQKSSKRQQAVTLRLEGKSYGEIARILNISSKGTLSYWFRNLALPQEAKKKLQRNISLAHERGLFHFNKTRSQNIAQENKKIRREAAESIPPISKKDLFLIGVALYWGEGYQSERTKDYNLRFVNSNPAMVALFLRFLREIISVEDEKIKAHIRLHPNIQRQQAACFWQKITNLPIERFRFTHQISKASKLRRPPNSLPHGTIDVRVNSRPLFFKIKGCIDGLAAQANLSSI